MKYFNRLSLGFVILVTIHLASCVITNDMSILSNAIVIWTIVGYLLCPKFQVNQNSFCRHHNPIAYGYGFLVFAILLTTLITQKPEFSLRLFPFLSSLGMVLIGFSFRGLREFWRELFLLLLLLFSHHGLQEKIVILGNLQSATILFSTTLLGFLGHVDVSTLNNFIILPPHGKVEVTPTCSGVATMIRLSAIALCLQTLNPTCILKNLLLPLAAIAFGFIFNGLRVAGLAILSGINPTWFNIMHQGSGGKITEIILFGAFVGIYYYIHHHNQHKLG
jgi:cyanoexosortase A